MEKSNPETQNDALLEPSESFTVESALNRVHAMFCLEDNQHRNDESNVMNSKDSPNYNYNNHDEFIDETELETNVRTNYENEERQYRYDTEENNKTLQFNWRDLVPMHYSTYHGNETNVVITITNYTTPREMVIFGNFVQRFNITIELTWSDRITHIVVNSKELCEYRFTDKIFKGVLSNKFIITMDWIRDCLESDFLISEHYYLPPDIKNETTFLRSLRYKLGIIYDPLEWIKNCVIYVYNIITDREWFEKIIEGMKKFGCEIINIIADFNNYSLRERIILVDISTEDYKNVQIPSKTCIEKWNYEYGALTVHMEWMFQCLSNYRRMDIYDFQVGLSPFSYIMAK